MGDAAVEDVELGGGQGIEAKPVVEDFDTPDADQLVAFGGKKVGSTEGMLVKVNGKSSRLSIISGPPSGAMGQK